MTIPTQPNVSDNAQSEPDSTVARVDAVATGTPIAYESMAPRATVVATSRVMTKKAKQLYESLARRGVDWHKMKMGFNPLVVPGITTVKHVGPNFLHIAVKELMDNGVVSLTALRDKFQQELEWSPSTAYSHVSIVQSLLTYVGVAYVDDDRLIRVTE